MNKKLFGVVSLVILFGFIVSIPLVSAATLSGWAWSSNVGWLSFNSSNANAGTGASYVVSIATTTAQPTLGAFSGYAWSPNVGWVSFNSSDTNGCPTIDSATDQPPKGAPIVPGQTYCNPRVDFSSGKVSGWARLLSMKNTGDGWLHLSGTNHPTGSGGVSYNTTTGVFSGYAWEPIALGWFSFDAGFTPVSIIINPPQGSIDAVCTLSYSSPTLTALLSSYSGGTAPYTIESLTSWTVTPNTNGSNQTFPIGYFSVDIKDSANPPARKQVSCPSITINGITGDEGSITLKGYKTIYDSGFTTVNVLNNQRVYMKWTVDSSINATQCKATIFPTSHQNDTWFDTWNKYVNNNFNPDIPYDLTNNLNTSNKIPTGRYTLGVSCYDEEGTEFMSIPSVNLTVQSSTVIEI